MGIHFLYIVMLTVAAPILGLTLFALFLSHRAVSRDDAAGRGGEGDALVVLLHPARNPHDDAHADLHNMQPAMSHADLHNMQPAMSHADLHNMQPAMSRAGVAEGMTIYDPFNAVCDACGHLYGSPNGALGIQYTPCPRAIITRQCTRYRSPVPAGDMPELVLQTRQLRLPFTKPQHDAVTAESERAMLNDEIAWDAMMRRQEGR